MSSQKMSELKKEIADLLKDKLAHKEITQEKALKIAGFALQALPDNLSDEQLDAIIPTLDDQFTELASIVHLHLQAFEDAHKQEVIAEADKLLHEGHLNAATERIREYLSSKILISKDKHS